ncbi:ABC protein [Gloeophyllum trabeum ATCC 11539]|uniref:ABC protein n=1 Tax=Gloeophyllum trabeum (strain ATCC 11539 / FP-39264 / Madison 617) TaxID=670483 RepID=S7PYC6_GLOTA|nr:ABC protein [Gloeophyllum trabeum ATCC 11539]EPQ52646.1 ABC protein [Gloeophyllum trabeum ATCC 11539]
MDEGNIKIKIRQSWWQYWRPKDPPPPAPTSLDAAPTIPLANASILSKLTYWWITPIMVLGYQRSLQATDLWKMDRSREAATLSEKLDASWDRRVREAEEWNARMDRGEIHPSFWLRMSWWWAGVWGLFRRPGKGGKRMSREERERRWREVEGRKAPSLAWSLNDTFGWEFWAAGAFKILGDVSQLMGPLVVRAIITFGRNHYTAIQAGKPPPSIGPGVGMAIGLFCLQVSASVGQHQWFWRSMTTGVLARAALTASIYKRGVNLTGKARVKLNNAALVNHISTDVSRIDAAAQWFHAAGTAPIQVTICLIILLVQLGPSALAGFSLFLIVAPVQERVMNYQFNVRKHSMKWTDMRAKLLLEILGAMRVVKYFTYENPFLKRIFGIRKKELDAIEKIQYARSANIALAFSVPALSATLALLAYTSTRSGFDVAIIFSSLSLFQLLRQPLMLLPRALTAITDGQNALSRLAVVFEAEQRKDDALVIDPDQDVAVKVLDATFEWEENTSPGESMSGGGKKDKKKDKKKKGGMVQERKEGGKPFQVKDINMTIERGQLAAIVGPVGSGKSSFLQGLVGEMRKVKGEVTFGGRVAYCPQSAWIQNATLKDNILFGQPFDEDRYWYAVEKASLLPDLQVLPDGDLTEIGEKGINLSGGQKQRVNIARALYFDADIVIFDDPLSAVDAHVGKALFADAIIGALKARGKTVILVTHALHFLSQCDYIYTMDDGRVVEQGTYPQLIEANGEFARLAKEFGGESTEMQEEESAEEGVEEAKPALRMDVEEAKLKSEKQAKRAGAGTGKLEGRLIVAEKRTTGSVSWGVYLEYLKAGRGWLTALPVIGSAMLMQGSQVLNSYTLIWWQENYFDRPTSFYQIIYAMMGVSQAIFTFTMGIAMDIMSYYVSQNLHHEALQNIFYAPMSFFDTTPTGRILSIFGKDIDTIDNQLPVSMRMSVLTLASVLGSIVIITILEPYFLIAAAGIAVLYNYFAKYYRASALEIKRLDSLLRSFLYAHFSESLTGLPTIRSYGELSRFVKDNKYYIDLEDRALILTVTNQRWLAIRLDFCGAMMTFIVSMLCVAGISGINPAQIGLVLTYTTSLVQLCGMVTRQTAETENYMNSVERVIHYSRGDLIEQEAPHEKPDCKPLSNWPSEGAIEFRDVKMSYRKGLPLVLKGISMNVHGGEKIGIVGRTGAGKSSLMLALFRIVELTSGSIIIDGLDISTLGLKDLRSKISIIPQDPLLFSGTIRSNLDPFDLYDDARLWDALRRSYLVDPDESSSAKSGPRYTLETPIESEGANLSVGERSLLSLARALVKDSKVVVLDEATASVDLETDSKIQQTIQTQFSDRTLLCIAHRLRTIISYDRILVLDAGLIAEFDTPMNLFSRRDSIFRAMCERSNITLEEIKRARENIAGASDTHSKH